MPHGIFINVNEHSLTLINECGTMVCQFPELLRTLPVLRFGFDMFEAVVHSVGESKSCSAAPFIDWSLGN